MHDIKEFITLLKKIWDFFFSTKRKNKEYYVLFPKSTLCARSEKKKRLLKSKLLIYKSCFLLREVKARS